MLDKDQIITKFGQVFGQKPSTVAFSPGRINLIGEHIDYNGGHVFPCAITLGTMGAARKRDDHQLRFYSANFSDEGIISVNLDDIHYDKQDKWTNFPKGVIHFLKEAGYDINAGMDVYVEGNIPNGAGLSSSASLELLIGVLCQDLFDLSIARIELVKIGVKTENDFIGLNSGIMDQFAVGMGERDHAIMLNTATLDYQLVPLDLGDNVIIIMNTNKRRELSDSKYNERRSECEQALANLQGKLDIKALCDIDFERFDQYSYLLENETLLKRARHAVTEDQRVKEAEKVLPAGKLATFGHLVNASHVSLQYDYQVTGKELDTLVHAAWQQPGCLGARMTGAGFGGCAIAIVQKDSVKAFEKAVADKYVQQIGYQPSFYQASIADGTKVLQ